MPPPLTEVAIPATATAPGYFDAGAYAAGSSIVASAPIPLDVYTVSDNSAASAPVLYGQRAANGDSDYNPYGSYL
jgi:hypothetical protein